MRATPSPGVFSTRRLRRRDGFALMVTIVLVAFLVLILVGLATFTRVETQVATNAQELAKARQNALFALNLAVGKLQQAAGPDQRVTATAEVLADASVPAAMRTDPTKRKWTGVWDPTDARWAPTYAGARPEPIWMVSGTSPTNVGAAPTVPAAGYSSTAVRLVGNATTDTTVPGNEVTVPLQELRCESVPGFVGEQLIGRFGFWVGDEGVKARVNLEDAFVSPVDFAERLNRIGLAQRSAVEWVQDGPNYVAGRNPDPFFPPDVHDIDAQLGSFVSAAGLSAINRILAPSQLSFLATSGQEAALRAASKSRFHDMSFSSSGVQADVRLGGLKRDLTAAFEMSDASFQASIFADAAPAAEKTIMAPGINPNRFVSPIYNHPVPLAPSGTGIYRGPTWHLLRGHYRLYREVMNGTVTPELTARALYPSDSSALPAADRIEDPFVDLFNGASVTGDPKSQDSVQKFGNVRVTPRATKPALLPYIQRFSFVVSLQTVPEASPPPGSEPGIPVYEVRVVITPIVVLHNPYNVRLNLVDRDGDGAWARLTMNGLVFKQLVRSGGYEMTLQTGSSIEERGIHLGAAARGALGPGSSYNDLVRLLIPAMTLGPGESRVFSPAGGTVPIGQNLSLSANMYQEGGYYLNQLNGRKYDYFQHGFGPATRKGWPLAPDDTVAPPDADAEPDPVDFPDNDDHRILVRNDRPLSLAVSVPDQNDNTLILQYFVESESSDSTSAVPDRLTMHTEVMVRPPGLGGDATSAAERAYANDYLAIFCGGQTPDNYEGDIVPMFVYDVYTKAADAAAQYAARPFMTSNPMAVVTDRDATGDYSTRGGRRGAYLGAPNMQPGYRWFPGGGNWTTDVFEADPSGTAYWGPSVTASGLGAVSLVEVPVRPMTSLAQFQHLMMTLYSNEPYFAFGNSESSPFIDRTERFHDARRGAGSWYFGDSSYLANEALWDRAFFSTLAPGFNGTAYYSGSAASDPNSRESVRDEWLVGSRTLPNARVRPYISPHRSATQREAGLLEPERAAANLLVDGTFNINSRSVEAWVALLGGARRAEVARLGGSSDGVGDEVAIPHALPSRGGSRGTADNNWNGFARLSDDDIRTLATNIVAEVKARQSPLSWGGANNHHPFFSVGEFVNRALIANDYGHHGALQRAINTSGLNTTIPGASVDNSSQATFPFQENGTGSSASAASGFLKQADILQQIGPFLSARSDTFTVRSYGETINPATGETGGRAWCEAVVQRTPDYVTGTDAPEAHPTDPSLSTDSRAFGRKFRIVSFRWLSAEDI